VHKPAEAGELAWKTIQRLMTVKEEKSAESKGPRRWVWKDIEAHTSPQHPKGKRTVWRSHSGTMKIRDVGKKGDEVIESARKG
jgi:hypothetical protein